VLVKICGIKDRAALDAASQAGADMLGFVFFPPSPRAVTPAEAAMLARSYAAGPNLRFGKPVMKALGIATKADLTRLADYADQVDYFLLDARPPPGSVLPGGNALAFDWSLMKDENPPRPWLLAGGLTPANVAQAIAASGAKGVDVSSGVEKARGEKDPAAIAAFIAAAKAASV